MSIFTSIGNIFSKIGAWVQGVFAKAQTELKRYLPIAINIVQKIKDYEDSPLVDILTGIIPGTVDDAIVKELRLIIPKILLDMELLEDVTNASTPEQITDAIQKFVNDLKFSSDTAKDAFYHNFSALILVQLSDGKFSWSEAVVDVEYYYQNFVKKSS